LKVLLPFLEKTPDVWGGSVLRRYVYKRLLGKCGTGSYFGENIVFSNHKKILIGKNTKIMKNCFLYAHNKGQIYIGNNCSINTNVQIGAADGGQIEIHDDCLIGPNTVIRAADHKFQSPNHLIRSQGHQGDKIIIEEDCWIGANVCILAGVKISKGSIIGAGAVVTKNIKSLSIAVGVPAKIISSRICKIRKPLKKYN